IRLKLDPRYFATDRIFGVRLPSLSSSLVNTLYVGIGGPGVQPAADAEYGQHAAYPDSVVASFALGDDPEGAAPQFLDRTANQLHGSPAVSGDGEPSLESIAAAVGNGINLGIARRIMTGVTDTYKPTGAMTVMCWCSGRGNTASGLNLLGAIHDTGRRGVGFGTTLSGELQVAIAPSTTTLEMRGIHGLPSNEAKTHY